MSRGGARPARLGARRARARAAGADRLPRGLRGPVPGVRQGPQRRARTSTSARPTRAGRSCASSSSTASRSVPEGSHGPQRPELAAGEHRAVGGERQAGLEADADRPVLAGGDEVDVDGRRRRGCAARHDHSRSVAAAVVVARTAGSGVPSRWWSGEAAVAASAAAPQPGRAGQQREVLRRVGAAADRSRRAARAASRSSVGARPQAGRDRGAVDDRRRRRRTGAGRSPRARSRRIAFGSVERRDDRAARALGVASSAARRAARARSRCAWRSGRTASSDRPQIPSRTIASAHADDLPPSSSATQQPPGSRRPGSASIRRSSQTRSAAAASRPGGGGRASSGHASRAAGTSLGLQRADPHPTVYPGAPMAVPKQKQSHARTNKRRSPAQGRAPDGQRVPDLPQPAPPAPGLPGLRHVRRP